MLMQHMLASPVPLNGIAKGLCSSCPRFGRGLIILEDAQQCRDPSTAPDHVLAEPVAADQGGKLRCIACCQCRPAWQL